jgi:integrase/recombinase XerD
VYGWARTSAQTAAPARYPAPRNPGRGGWARTYISPHTLRHTKAMHLLQAGVAPVTIKDILGHAHLKTLDIYVQADIEMMREAIEGTPSPVDSSARAPKHEPDLLRWLEEL